MAAGWRGWKWHVCVSVCTVPAPVNVKWGKEKFDAVELNTEEPPMVFKAQLFALTGVQPDRQKVMVKGGTLKVSTQTTHRTLVLKGSNTQPQFCILLMSTNAVKTPKSTIILIMNWSYWRKVNESSTHYQLIKHVQLEQTRANQEINFINWRKLLQVAKTTGEMFPGVQRKDEPGCSSLLCEVPSPLASSRLQ